MPATYISAAGGGGPGAETQTAISGIAASNTVYTSGTVTITGVGGGITVSSNTGQRVDLSVAAQSVQTQITAVQAISNSQASRSGTVNLSGAGIVNVGTETGNAFTISASQSVQTQSMVNAISNSQASMSGTVKLSGAGAVNVGSQTGNAFTISAPVQTAETAISGIAASNTTYTSGTVTFTGVGGGVTVSSNTGQRVDISVAAPVAQSAQTGISGIGASDTTYTSGTVIFTGSNAVTVKSTTGQKVIIDAPTQTAETAISGIAASNTTYTSGTVTFTGVGGGVTVSSNTGQRVDISVASAITLSSIKALPGGAIGNNSQGMINATLMLVPMEVPGYLTAHTAQMPISASGASNSSAQASMSMGIYSQNGRSLSLATSGSMSTSWTSNSVAAGDWLGVYGWRPWAITNQTWQMTPGNWVAAVWFRSSNAGSYTYAAQGINSGISGKLGAASNTSDGLVPWLGMYSASFTTAMPTQITAGHVRGEVPALLVRAPADQMWFNSNWGT